MRGRIAMERPPVWRETEPFSALLCRCAFRCSPERRTSISDGGPELGEFEPTGELAQMPGRRKASRVMRITTSLKPGTRGSARRS